MIGLVGEKKAHSMFQLMRRNSLGRTVQTREKRNSRFGMIDIYSSEVFFDMDTVVMHFKKKISAYINPKGKEKRWCDSWQTIIDMCEKLDDASKRVL